MGTGALCLRSCKPLGHGGAWIGQQESGIIVRMKVKDKGDSTLILMHHGNGYVGFCRVVALRREGKDQSTWTSTSRGEVARQSPRGHSNFTHAVAPLGCKKHIGGDVVRICHVWDYGLTFILFSSLYFLFQIFK